MDDNAKGNMYEWNTTMSHEHDEQATFLYKVEQ